MKKLRAVRAALQVNSLIVFEEGERQESLPNRYAPAGLDFATTTTFYVAPERPLFDVEGLQAFMMGLVPFVEYHADDFWEFPDGGLRLGTLTFDEIIGLTKHEHTLSDPEIALPDGWIDNKISFERPIKSRTWVRVCPSALILEALRSGVLHGDIKVGDLERYKQSSALA